MGFDRPDGAVKLMIPGITAVSELGSFPPQNDPYFSYVKLLLPFDGANGATTFTDESPIGRTVTGFAGASLTDAFQRFGPTSLNLTGGDKYLSIADSDDFWMSNLDFTFECWVYTATAATFGALISQRADFNNNESFSLHLGSEGTKPTFEYSIGSGVVTLAALAGAAPVGQWNHVAASRVGSTIRLYVNGAIAASSTVGTSSLVNSSAQVVIGRLNAASAGGYLNGYIDDIRITRGRSRYAGAFTPPNWPSPLA